ncbi:MAG TPA: RidA family protein [Sphingomonas sp.]|jgi:enamine deaminase RidA (YjgF/YER057c/UK114 family)|uniref:RidA family protein n=1 Tax=Sphingomonas sp. TaxID=28214 RepID=UPI002ED95B8D
MRVHSKSKLLILAAAVAAAAPAVAAPLVRHKGAPDAIILQGVTVPAGSETLILSGQLASPIDPSRPATTIADYGDTKTQTVSTFKRIETILKAHGYAMGDVVKLTVFVAGDAKLGGKMDFAGFNDGYKQFFGTPEQPNLVARSTVQVAALAGPMYLIEIEAIAVKAPQ